MAAKRNTGYDGGKSKVNSGGIVNVDEVGSRRRLQGIILFLACLGGIAYVWITAISEDESLETIRGGSSGSGGGGSVAYKDNFKYEENLLSTNNENDGGDNINAGGEGGTANNNDNFKNQDSSPSTTENSGGENPGTTSGAVGGSNLDCASLCRARRETRTETYGADLLDRNAMLNILLQEKEKLIQNLHKDYGKEHFENIFVDKRASTGGEERYRGIAPTLPTGSKSIETLKRKFLIKLLSSQTSMVQKDAQATGCDCVNGDKPLSGNMLRRTESTMATGTDAMHARYVWATGGHSSAAGHGNLYNESYTAYMERDLKPIFGALGVEFEGRNYAMGGTTAGYEVSMCFEQIFGNDVDFFVWDYGMTDGREVLRLLHYTYRGALNPSHPATIALHVTGRPANARLAQLRHMEMRGLAAFSSTEESEMYAAIPDCAGLSDAEIDALPEYVRNFKCEGKLESGDPYCGNEKYSKFICPVRWKQASWHPGFKMHALDGHSLALFMVQHLVDAVKDLAGYEEKDPEKLLATLKAEDDQVYSNFVNSELPDAAKQVAANNDGEPYYGIDNEVLFRGPSICRTGRLPAQSRYLGYMTNYGKTGGIAPFTKEEYETGITENEAINTASESNEEMRLVYSSDVKERDPRCTEVLLKPDYKDFFYSRFDDGLTKLVLPNEAEKAAYRYNENSYKGLLFVFFVGCDWGRCPNGELRNAEVESGRLKMFVNGKPVKLLKDVGSDAMMLVGEDDGIYWEANSQGQYEIAFQATEPKSYVRISAVALY